MTESEGCSRNEGPGNPQSSTLDLPESNSSPSEQDLAEAPNSTSDFQQSNTSPSEEGVADGPTSKLYPQGSNTSPGEQTPIKAQNSTLELLESEAFRKLLDDIDEVRRAQVSHRIELPSIVVVGDTSSGKSSLLEAISDIRFPVKGGLCTRFVTELVLRREKTQRPGKATIVAGGKSTNEHKQRVETFSMELPRLDDISSVFAEAEKAMGISNSKQISDDVLYLEAYGPNLPNLTLVDVPGLIHSGTNDVDPEFVKQLVLKYMRNKRSLILAVIAADQPFQNQAVLDLASKNDLDRTRTIGVLTKPDLVESKGLQQDVLELAMNQNETYKFHHQWQVLRNPTHLERTKGSEYKFERINCEQELFGREPWNSLKPEQLGVDSLVKNLQRYLLELIRTELPPVIRDIQEKISACEDVKRQLKDERSTTESQRTYLTNISTQYSHFVQAALTGHYDDSFFSNGEKSKRRLRAQAWRLTDAFDATMRERGHTHEVCNPKKIKDKDSQPDSGALTTPVRITKEDFIRMVHKIARDLRGTELPSLPNPHHVGVIFRMESVNWEPIALQFAHEFGRAVWTFLRELIHDLCPESSETAEVLLRELFNPALEKSKEALLLKIEEILLPFKKLPLYTSLDRLQRGLAVIKAKDEAEIPLEFSGREKVKAEIINYQACLDIAQWARAYYVVALDTFTENFIVLAIENCLLVQLPEMLSATAVDKMDERTLKLLAGEPQHITKKRRDNLDTLAVLKKALMTCKQHLDINSDFVQPFQEQSGDWVPLEWENAPLRTVQVTAG